MKDIKDPRIDYSEALKKVMEVDDYRYRGVLFTRTKEGFCRNGILCKTAAEMDELIDKGANAFTQSINRLKK